MRDEIAKIIRDSSSMFHEDADQVLALMRERMPSEDEIVEHINDAQGYIMYGQQRVIASVIDFITKRLGLEE